MSEREQLINSIVAEVVQKLQASGTLAKAAAAGAGRANGRAAVAAVSRPAAHETSPAGRDGLFPTVDSAVKAAAASQERLARLGLEERGRAIEVIRDMCDDKAEEWGRAEMEETKIGRLEHKIEKLRIIRKVLGVEAMQSAVRTDASGVAIIEAAPWGVIAMALPATHSVPTMAANAINVIAAGNTAVFTPHPAARKIATLALQAFNREIEKKTGLRDLLCTIENPTIEAGGELFAHPGIALICVTGGPAVVKAAMTAGKRVIAAGPGNPPVVVDCGADLDKAARDIIEGCAWDNNLLCIGEKEVFVLERAADEFIAAMRRAGAVQLDAQQIERLTQAVFTFDRGQGTGCARAHVKRDYVGRGARILAELAGVRVPPETLVIFGETDEDHPFVQEEQMMPFLPIVRVPDFDAAVAAALRAEHGYRHTALIHSRNPEHITRMARAMNTTLFVANAPCGAALGQGEPGYLSYSIATPTGEGVTTPLTFTRHRQLAMVGSLRFI